MRQILCFVFGLSHCCFVFSTTIAQGRKSVNTEIQKQAKERLAREKFWIKKLKTVFQEGKIENHKMSFVTQASVQNFYIFEKLFLLPNNKIDKILTAI